MKSLFKPKDPLAEAERAYDNVQSRGEILRPIPVAAPLKAALDAVKKQGPLILTNSLGRPWTSHGFQAYGARDGILVGAAFAFLILAVLLNFVTQDSNVAAVSHGMKASTQASLASSASERVAGADC